MSEREISDFINVVSEKKTEVKVGETVNGDLNVPTI